VLIGGKVSGAKVLPEINIPREKSAVLAAVERRNQAVRLSDVRATFPVNCHFL
jgi:hypothetical protein